MSEICYALKCDDCGKFMAWKPGASSATIYDFVAMEPSHDHFRCVPCGERLGPVYSNARPYNGDLSPFQSRA